ncbi:MAG: hypothetical protein H6Q03_2910, partial [Acidobacteria bacterium]|nr:hypothetical protein [Acidobacteriota bacterium]
MKRVATWTAAAILLAATLGLVASPAGAQTPA